MKSFCKVVTCLILSLFGVMGVTSVYAQQMTDQASALPSTPMSEGEIRNIDRRLGKLTIKHGELKNLGMPAMTMGFHVKDAAALDQVKIGDKVRFIAEMTDGTLTATQIQKNPQPAESAK